MNKRSFFLGLLSGIIISLVIYFTMPFFDNLLNNNNSTRKVVQTFADSIASGDRTTAVSLLINPDSVINIGVVTETLEKSVDGLFGKGIVLVGKHVPITLVSSTEITPAMRANGVSRYELWCASFVTEDNGNYQDYIIPTIAETVNGNSYISSIGSIGFDLSADCRK